MKFRKLLANDLAFLKKQTHRLLHLDSHEKLLLCFMLLYVFYFTYASFLRFDNYYTGRFDLGNMVQAVWNTAYGRIFEVTNPNKLGMMSRLGYHADFLLILFAPFYLIWESPKLLLLSQTIILALGAIFVYKLGVHVLHRKTISLIFAIAYLFNPSLERSNLYDFHAVVLATTFLLAAFYFVKLRRYVWFLLFALLAALTKEEVWAVVGLFGLFIILRAAYSLRATAAAFRNVLRKEIIFGVLVAAVSFGMFYFLFSIAIPSVYGRPHFASTYFGDFGDKPVTIAKGILTSPGKVIGLLLEENRKTYLRELFLPLGYLSIFSPLYMFFALPDFLINLLSSNENFQEIYFQYTATITPFLFIAGIYGVRLIRYFAPKVSLTILSIYLLIMMAYGAYLYGPLPFAREPNTAMFTPRANRLTIDAYLATIPVEDVVTANNQLGSHLSVRPYLYTLPDGLDKAKYVLFLLSDSTASPSVAANVALADSLKNDPNYILIFQQGDFLVFKKNTLSFPVH